MDTAAPNINLSAVRAVDIPEKIAFSPDGSWELTDQLSESRPLRSPVTVGGCLLCCVGSQRGREGCLGVFSAERPAKSRATRSVVPPSRWGRRPAAGLLALQPCAGSRSNVCLDAKAKHL